MKSLSTPDVSLAHVIEGHSTESKQSPEASQIDLKGWGGVHGTEIGQNPENSLQSGWVVRSSGCQTPPPCVVHWLWTALLQ